MSKKAKWSEQQNWEYIVLAHISPEEAKHAVLYGDAHYYLEYLAKEKSEELKVPNHIFNKVVFNVAERIPV